MKFSEHFWYLAHRPLKLVEESKSQIAILLKALGAQFDLAKQAVFSIRQNANIMTADEKALNYHGQDRGLVRYQDEDVEAYRERILAKQEVARLAGTKRGIIRGVTALGYPDVEVIRTAVYDSAHWAEFFVLLNAETLGELNNLSAVKREVMKLKEASSMPNFSYLYRNEIDVNSSMNYGFQSPPIAGAYTCGQGAVRL